VREETCEGNMSACCRSSLIQPLLPNHQLGGLLISVIESC